ncbi:S8 family peptidase [Paenibacillus rigui]|uniref:Peptidase S8 n=1 Tax=Paenibacillus rigui TaxID=554312 RepID=A0A229ULL0_9BACL|nr:S8 family peptidase [Paenibacillus rigui]OXM84263.1 peptidase S8 [Paenibacillus rigui]
MGNKNIRPMTRTLQQALNRTSRKPDSKALIPVIVQFQSPDHRKQAADLKKRIAGHAYREKGHLWVIRGWSAHVSRACLKRICACKGVSKVYMDRRNKALLNIATPSVGGTAARKKGITGKGVTIAILDTGIAAHPDLTKPGNRIAGFKDFIHGRSKPYDDNGHGTHVAGDAAGNGYASKGKYRGIAPQAKLVGVKVLDQNGSGFDSTIIRGIQWCITNRKRYGIRVLNLSLGKPATERWTRDPLCRAIDKAVKAGIVVTVAAGNEGPGPRTISSPGITPSAITVGAVNDRRTIRQSDDRMAGFSSRGPAYGGIKKPDLVAPGVGIVSLRVPGSLFDRTVPRGKLGKYYIRLSGTSFSSPLTAGAAALLLQKQPGLRPSQVKQRLKAKTFPLPFGQYARGSGELNVRFAAGKKR